MAADTEFGNKLNAALRYGGASAGTMIGVFGAMQFVTPEQAQELVVQVHVLNESVLTMYGALSKMMVILGPMGVVVAGYFGIKSSSVKELAGKLLRIAANKASPEQALEAKVAIVNAAASPQIGSQGVVNKELASNPQTAGNVVAAPELVPATQPVVLAAVAGKGQ